MLKFWGLSTLKEFFWQIQKSAFVSQERWIHCFPPFGERISHCTDFSSGLGITSPFTPLSLLFRATARSGLGTRKVSATGGSFSSWVEWSCDVVISDAFDMTICLNVCILFRMILKSISWVRDCSSNFWQLSHLWMKSRQGWSANFCCWLFEVKHVEQEIQEIPSCRSVKGQSTSAGQVKLFQRLPEGGKGWQGMARARVHLYKSWHPTWAMMWSVTSQDKCPHWWAPLKPKTSRRVRRSLGPALRCDQATRGRKRRKGKRKRKRTNIAKKSNRNKKKWR